MEATVGRRLLSIHLPNIDQLQHEVSSSISNFEGGATPKSLTQIQVNKSLQLVVQHYFIVIAIALLAIQLK